MSTQPIRGALAGVDFEFTCDSAAVDAYARAHLAPLLAVGGGVARVAGTLCWREALPTKHRPETAAMDRVDRDLYVGSDRLCWYRVDDLRDLFLEMTWKGGVLQASGEFFFRLGNSPWSDRLRRWRQAGALPALRQRRLPTLMSYLIYYPCWWWLEENEDFHPIHAAGVATEHGVVLLAGASGVGKSTLATAMAATADGKMLGDSFVMHSGIRVRSVHEPILLDDWSRSWLGARAAALAPIERAYMLQRSGYQMRPERRAESGEAALLLFPRRSPQPYVRPISSELARQRLSAADLIINDLRRYFAYAAVLEQLVPRGLVARREAHLAQLTSAVPAYEVGLTADMSCDAAVDAVMGLLRTTPLRAVGS